jgi:asparagine synthetase B (glutamine-hydrolysing)
MIDRILSDIIDREVQSDEVALLLSGGVDSISLGITAQKLGKRISAYTFHLEDEPSYDSDTAQHVAKTFGWDIDVTVVSKTNLKKDFFTLLREYDCKKKTHFECTHFGLYLYPKIKEKYVLSGIAADGWYGVSKKARIEFIHTKEKFDEFRKNYFSAENPAGILQQKMLAENYNKILVHPYLWYDKVRNFFMQYDWNELHQNKTEKYHVRTCYRNEFNRLNKIKTHLNLQLESKTDILFESLLDDNEINFKRRTRIIDICKDWSLLNSYKYTLEDFM